MWLTHKPWSYFYIPTGQLVSQFHMHFDQCIALDRSEVCSSVPAAWFKPIRFAMISLELLAPVFVLKIF